MATKTTTFRIDETIYQQAEAYGAETGRPPTEIFRQLIGEGMQRVRREMQQESLHRGVMTEPVR